MTYADGAGELTAKLLKLGLATEAAVRCGLSDDLRSRLGKMATEKVKRKLWDEEEGVETA